MANEQIVRFIKDTAIKYGKSNGILSIFNSQLPAQRKICTFISEIENESDAEVIVLSLLKFCMVKDPKDNASTALFDEIITQFASKASNYEMKTSDDSVSLFFKKISDTIKNNLPKQITDISKLINDLEKLLAILLLNSNDTSKQITDLVSIIGRAYIDQWKMNKSNQSAIMHTMPMPGTYSTVASHFWAPIPIAETIYLLLKDEDFKKIPAKRRGLILSMPYQDEHTALQELSLAFAYMPSVIAEIMIQILKTDAIAVANEKSHYWIEMVLPHVKDAKQWNKILDAIPQSMLEVFYIKELHIVPSILLADKLKKIDFWTRSLSENCIESEKILYDTRQAILKGYKDKTVHDCKDGAFIKKHYQNVNALIKLSQIQSASISQTSLYNTPVIDNVTPELLDGIFSTTPYHETEYTQYYRKQLNLLNKCETDPGHPGRSFSATYFITNYIQYAIRYTTNIHGFFVPRVLKSHIYSVIASEHKNEIRLSIQKSLEIWFDAYYTPHAIIKNEYSSIMIKKFLSLLRFLEIIFEMFNLDFETIIVNNPTSNKILANYLMICMVYANPSDRELFQNTELYKHLSGEAKQSIKNIESKVNEKSKFVESIEGAARSYLSSLKNNLKVNNNTNLTYAQLSFSFAVNTNNGDLKSIMCIIDYAIHSYKEDIFEKSFLSELKDKINDKWSEQIDLKNDTIFIIAQIDASLRKLSMKHYQHPEKAKSLLKFLTRLLTDFNIKVDQLDIHSQVIMINLEIAASHTDAFSKISEELNDILQELIMSYCLNKGFKVNNEKTGILMTSLSDEQPNASDAAGCIDLLSVIGILDNTQAFTSDFVKNALQFKYEKFDAAEYFISHSYHKPNFIKIWLCMLVENLTTKTEVIIDKNKSVNIFYGIVPDAKNLVKMLFDNPHFDKLTGAQKTEILSIPITYNIKNKPQKNALVYKDNEYKNITNLINHYSANSLDNILEGDKTHTTFISEKWYTYNTANENQYASISLVQALAIECTNERIVEMLDLINQVLEYVPNQINQNKSIGSWIEILFIQLSNKNESTKRNALKLLISELYLLKEALYSFLFNGIIDKFINTLTDQMNPLADTQQDKLTYQIYYTLVLRTVFNYPENITQEQVQKICKLLLHFPDLHDYFSSAYKALDTQSNLKTLMNESLQAVIPHALAPQQRINKLLNGLNIEMKDTSNDQHYIYAMQLCKIIKDLLALPLSSLPKKNIDFEEIFIQCFTVNTKKDDFESIIFSIEEKLEIYKSIILSIRYSADNVKWVAPEFLQNVMRLFNNIASVTNLDVSKMIPDDLDIILQSVYRVNHFEILTNLPDKFAYLGVKSNDKFGDYHHTLMITVNQESFMSTIIANAHQYTQDPWAMNKKGNEHNVKYAKNIAGLKSTYDNAEGDLIKRHQLFILAIIWIMEYRFASYKDWTYDKGFYLTCLEAPLSDLNKGINLKDALKNALTEKMKCMFNEVNKHIYNHSPDRYDSYKKTAVFFNELLSLNLEIVSSDAGLRIIFENNSSSADLNHSATDTLNQYLLLVKPAAEINANSNSIYNMEMKK